MQVPVATTRGRVEMLFETCSVVIGSKNLYVYFPQAVNRKFIIGLQYQIERVLVHGYNHNQIVFHIKDYAKSHDLVFEIAQVKKDEKGQKKEDSGAVSVNDITFDNLDVSVSYQQKLTFLSYLADAYRFANRSKHGEKKDVAEIPIFVRFFVLHKLVHSLHRMVLVTQFYSFVYLFVCLFFVVASLYAMILLPMQEERTMHLYLMKRVKYKTCTTFPYSILNTTMQD